MNLNYRSAKGKIPQVRSDSLSGISFGQDASGNWGYIKAGADTVTPFKKVIFPYEKSWNLEINADTDIFLEGYKPIAMKSAEFHRGYENCNPLSFSITLNSNENTISSFLSYSGQLNSYGMSAVVLYIPDTVFPNIDEKEIPLTRGYDISGNESTSEGYLLCGASYIWGQRRYSDADAQGKWIYSSETSGNYRFYFSGSSYINDAYVSIKNIYVK